MKWIWVGLLGLLASSVVAQTKVTRIVLQPGIRLGMPTNWERMFGNPFFVGGCVGVSLNDRWLFGVDAGGTAFRDAKFPDQKFGLIFSSFSRYRHEYVGVKVGYQVLPEGSSCKLQLSTGANYIYISDPNITYKGGWFGPYGYNYIDHRLVNVPIQADLHFKPFYRNSQARVFVSSRLNLNSYHLFATASIHLNIPIALRSSKSAQLQKE
jgi:hypothetical protein